MEPLNSSLLAQSMNFHGNQLQKVWDAEHGDTNLMKNDVNDLNFQVYGQRQKHLTFQDRGKRLKLHQFIAKRGNVLFSKDVTAKKVVADEGEVTEDTYAIMPPFETFLNVDKQRRLKYFFEKVKVGDLILGTIVSKTQSGMMLKVLCTTGVGATVRYVADINVKAFCPVANIIPAVDKKGVTRSYMMNDSVCCEVLEVIPDTDKMVCGMKGTTRQPSDPEPHPPLGLIHTEDLPLVYKKALDHKNESYEAVLEKSIGFNNPNNIVYLSGVLGIDGYNTLMSTMSGRFPENEYASELRQVQASKWAYRNVADGIVHFNAGNHTEAFQCINKALTIDPKNADGLVARGAMYVNSGNFQKGIEEFETALKLNPSHANARKYMGETLVALGKSYEEENKLEEARKAYQSCLSLIPYHQDAQNSLAALKTKMQSNPGMNLFESGDLLLPNLSAGSAANRNNDVHDALKQLLKKEEGEKKDKKKKKKSKKRKSRRRSSSSSSSSSSGSNDSSSSSSSSSSDSSSSSGDSDFKKHKKRRSRSHRREKQSSLSPLSKRMAMMDPNHDTPTNYQFNKPSTSGSFEYEFEQPVEQAKSETKVSYEQQVRAFLEQTKDDSDYEEKVRKFMEQTAKLKKGKSDEKKKKKKKDKKAKKESKKKKKEKKMKKRGFDLSEYEEHLENKKLRDALKKELGIKEKKSKKHGLTSDDEEYGYSKRFLENLPDLEELESKLKAYYALGKESKRSEGDSPKRLLDSPSPTREQKARQAVAEAAASVSSMGGKWKMQIGNATAGSSRFKKRPEREDWSEEQEKRLQMKGDDIVEDPSKNSIAAAAALQQPSPAADKNMSVRKAMAMKEPQPPPLPSSKKEPEPLRKPKGLPVAPTTNPMIAPGQVVLDKFGNFRLVTPPENKKPGGDGQPPLPPGAPPKAYAGGRSKPPEPPGRPRSGSRSPKRHSRSRSRGGKYSRSRSRTSSRSRSYRSRSRSYDSRSRSRSGSYYSRSRSRSRSYSGDRRRYRRGGGGFRGRYNDRGTYYKPRFQNPRNNPRGRGGGGGGYYNRDSRYNDRDFRGGRGRPYNNYGRGPRRPRGRFQRGGYRDYRDRRNDRSRSRDRSRSYSGSREREPDDTMRKSVNEEKDVVSKQQVENNGNAEPPVRHEGPLSEGEDRDDYSGEKFVDREAFDGKWAEKEGESGGNAEAPDGASVAS